ncbi:MAG: nucleoside hydrolase [Nitrososphaerota archaeon]|nr:nucleoside hydrolase [Nitrososphaerota archaeon]
MRASLPRSEVPDPAAERSSPASVLHSSSLRDFSALAALSVLDTPLQVAAVGGPIKVLAAQVSYHPGSGTSAVRRLLLDTDTAGDDTIAILMALRARDAVLEGITINCGNVDFEQQVENALYTVQVAGRSGKVPVYPGSTHPLLKEWRTAKEVHGNDGMGGSYFPKAKQRPETTHAVDAIVDTINSNPGEIDLVEIAPMTNLAIAIRKDPGIVKKVRRFYFMGGSNQYLGNVTPAAEFNIWVDPDAARIVFESGLPATMVGWEICMRRGFLGARELDRIEAMGTGESKFFLAVNREVRRFTKRTYGLDGTECTDSLTMSMVLNPRVASDVRKKFVEVDSTDGPSRGATVVDERGVLGKKPNVDVVYEASQKLFREMLYRTLSGGPV